LVVEDDVAIRELLRLHLSLAGFELAETGHGASALELCRTTTFDLIVLDVMLPGLDGVTLCRAIRNEGPNRDSGVLMLTARDAESDKMLGLESGADDYLTKPFGIHETDRAGWCDSATQQARRARGRAVVAPGAVARRDRGPRQAAGRGARPGRRSDQAGIRPVASLRDTSGDCVQQNCTDHKSVGGGDTYVTERTVDAVVSRLRRKLERDAQDPELILTAWGVGYRFVDVE